jgi:hypothetical protein
MIFGAGLVITDGTEVGIVIQDKPTLGYIKTGGILTTTDYGMVSLLFVVEKIIVFFQNMYILILHSIETLIKHKKNCLKNWE